MHWAPVNPAAARNLVDARLQLHHAVQLATALGISYVPARLDDSHTSLEWLAKRGALASNEQGGTRIAVRVADLAVFVGEKSFRLHGQTVEAAVAWIRPQLSGAGLDGERYTLARHYEIPHHAVADGAPFDAKREDLAELARWLDNAAARLEGLRKVQAGASEVRCWPHHFDIATLITVSPGKTVGVGLEPGDVYYDEPYFYVNLRPVPAPAELPDSLEGDGVWHTRDWIGAVLPVSRLSPDPAAQPKQVDAFLESAVRTCQELVSR